MAKSLHIYFSFRSPYAWLACFRFSHIVNELGVNWKLIPVSPPKKIALQTMPPATKLAYVRQDVERMAAAWGLQYTRPRLLDCDWFIPHAAFLHADKLGKGLEFVNALYQRRFCEGNDISQHSELAAAAQACALDADAIIAASGDRNNRRQLLRILASLDEQGIFGVPVFVYDECLFWGNDRLEWCLRAIYEDQGRAVPDLCTDVMARPF